MIKLFEGLNGAGKTMALTKLLFEDWKNGSKIYPNYPLTFPNDNERVERWSQLPEIYHITDGVIAIDEAQYLFDARRWQMTPMSFLAKIAQHRKDMLDVYTTTQSYSDIDYRFRKLVHERFICQSLVRFPPNDRVKPIFQWIRVIRKVRVYSGDKDTIVYKQQGRARFMFLSRFWTKKLYETYQKVGLSKFLCQAEYILKSGKKKAEWVVYITDRDLINTGQARK